jgi:hypothetical protein
LVHEHVIAYLGGLPDDHASAMVYEKAPADFGSGVNFDAGEEAAGVREQAGQEAAPVLPQEVRQAMTPDGMQAGIAEEHLWHTSGRRVLGEYGAYVFSYRPEQDA